MAKKEKKQLSPKTKKAISVTSQMFNVVISFFSFLVFFIMGIYKLSTKGPSVSGIFTLISSLIMLATFIVELIFAIRTIKNIGDLKNLKRYKLVMAWTKQGIKLLKAIINLIVVIVTVNGAASMGFGEYLTVILAVISLITGIFGFLFFLLTKLINLIIRKVKAKNKEKKEAEAKKLAENGEKPAEETSEEKPEEKLEEIDQNLEGIDL